MRALVAMLCILGLMSNALAEAAENIGPYESDGSNSVEIVSLSVPSPNGAFTTTAYIPSGAGPFPVLIFSPGFFQKGIAYAPYARRLGSWGIVTLLRDDPNFFADESRSDDLSRPDTVKTGAMADHMALDVAYEVMTWLPATNADPGSALYGKVDTKRVGLAGHSSGARIALVVGEALPGLIKGVFGLDPVDLSARAPARPKLASIGIQVAFIGETTNITGSPVLPGGSTIRPSIVPPARLPWPSPRSTPTTRCLKTLPIARGAGFASPQGLRMRPRFLPTQFVT